MSEHLRTFRMHGRQLCELLVVCEREPHCSGYACDPIASSVGLSVRLGINENKKQTDQE